MNKGQELLALSKHGLNYNKRYLHIPNLRAICNIHAIIEEEAELEGYISDDNGSRIEKESETDLLLERLDGAFEKRDVYNQVIKELKKYELYQLLADMEKPLD